VRCAQVKIVNGKCVEARKFDPPPSLKWKLFMKYMFAPSFQKSDKDLVYIIL